MVFCFFVFVLCHVMCLLGVYVVGDTVEKVSLSSGSPASHFQKEKCSG